MSRSRKLPLFLDDASPEKLLAAATTERDRLLLLCGLAIGLRVSEICHLQVDHLDFGRRTLMVREGKGCKDRCLPLPDLLHGPLRGWCRGRRSGYVFPSPRGAALTTRAVQKLLKRVARAAGLSLAPRAITPHKLRHTFASRTLEAGATIFEVSELLGHSSVAVTQVYLHTDMGRLAQAVNRVYS